MERDLFHNQRRSSIVRVASGISVIVMSRVHHYTRRVRFSRERRFSAAPTATGRRTGRRRDASRGGNGVDPGTVWCVRCVRRNPLAAQRWSVSLQFSAATTRKKKKTHAQ